MKASELKIGQLCWFDNSFLSEDKLIGILKEKTFFETGHNAYISDLDVRFDVCQPLSAEEIRQFMELVK